MNELLKKEGLLLYLLNKTSHLIKWEINKRLKDYQLTSAQWRVLMDLNYFESIGCHEKNATPAMIAERLNVERPAITRVIDTLLKEGWVARIEHPSDRRSQLIVLTDKAREILPQLRKIGEDVIEKSFQGFEDNDIEALIHYLKNVIKNYCGDS